VRIRVYRTARQPLVFAKLVRPDGFCRVSP